jgi:hypothetical protein
LERNKKVMEQSQFTRRPAPNHLPEWHPLLRDGQLLVDRHTIVQCHPEHPSYLIFTSISDILRSCSFDRNKPLHGDRYPSPQGGIWQVWREHAL